MKLELAKKIVALDQQITATEGVIKYFEDPDGFPRVKVEFDCYATGNALENELGITRDMIEKDWNAHTIQLLKDHRINLQEQMMELENEA